MPAVTGEIRNGLSRADKVICQEIKIVFPFHCHSSVYDVVFWICCWAIQSCKYNGMVTFYAFIHFYRTLISSFEFGIGFCPNHKIRTRGIPTIKAWIGRWSITWENIYLPENILLLFRMKMSSMTDFKQNAQVGN